MKKSLITFIIAILVLIGLIVVAKRHQPADVSSGTTSNPPVTYACANNKSITATFTNGTAVPAANPDMPPTPTGTAHLVLSDGRTMDLKQTISADGVRYSNGDPNVQGGETFVFWSKGNGALVLENNEEKSYIGCVQVSSDSSLPQAYTDPSGAFSLRLPQGYTVDTTYAYQLNPTTKIKGTKFTVPASLAQGTNLGTDSYISVEQIPNAKTCTAGLFLDGSNPVTTQTDNGVTYSVSSSAGAGAGNRYEETVYAIPSTSPCTAVRYLVHSSVFENYPAGTVTRFDEAGLKQTFDQVRRSLVLGKK